MSTKLVVETCSAGFDGKCRPRDSCVLNVVIRDAEMTRRHMPVRFNIRMQTNSNLNV